MSIKISIVEDDDRVRNGIVTLIDGTEGYRCISSFASAEDGLKGLPLQIPDVVLMDINLPRMSGIECVRLLKKMIPEIQIIMLTIYEDSGLIFDSLKAGANGYLLKRAAPAELLQAIKEVKQGGSPMTSQIARKVVQYFQKSTQSDDISKKLTQREEEILNLLSKGFRYKEIAEKLFISIETVHSHIHKIYEKLQVRSRTEAVVKYLNR